MDLFYILKLNVSTIIENNLKINVSFEDAKKKGWVVSIGDNQILKFIRDIKCIDFDKQKQKIATLYRKRNKIKSLPRSTDNSKQIYNYQKQIDNLLYVPDIISLHANTTKKDYEYVAKNLFEVNEITYRRLCAGAGQLRRNTVLFINEKIYSELEKLMMCGLTKKRIGKINLSKFSAYYSLYSSSTNFIRSPRVCVVNDYERTLKNREVEWIYQKKDGKRDIEPKITDIKQNVFDGSGLVSIDMAEKWKNDLGLDYTPSAFIVRSAWIKGLCVVFDWKKFARTIAETEYVTDVWGKTWEIDKIDVLLSVSQFKMWKKYKDWEEYLNYHREYGHIWGCSRVNKKNDNYFTALNYQYIQSNNFTEETIKKLADFSIDWVKKVCTGERIYVLLYLLGCHESDKDIRDIENSTGMNITKALMYDESILNDSYVRNRIYKSIEKQIKQIKIGKLLVEGSYEFAMVDPYMQCEFIFGMKPEGLLKENELWQKRWVDKGSIEVALMRSPLVSPHENNILNVYTDKKCEDWYSTIKSGVVLNGWDTALMRASDGDVDGDLLLTSDNLYLVNAIDRTLSPIAYETSDVKQQFLSYKNLSKMDTRSFNTKIGFITNLATTFICLRERFKKESEEYKELTKRINLLRFHQGSAIDAGKGSVYIPPPRHWSKRKKIDWDKDSKIERQKKLWINRLVGDKKSYFMIYIYPTLMKSYKQHKESSRRVCRAMFGCKLDELLRNKNKSKEERRFIENYYKYMPVLINKSILNQLCWYVEDVDFNLKYFKRNVDFDYRILMNKNIIVDTDSNLYKKIYETLKKYYRIYELNSFEREIINEEFQEQEEEEIDEELSILFSEIETDLFNVCSNSQELCNYIIYIMYNKFKNKTKAIMWNICGRDIVENLKLNGRLAVFPVESNVSEGVEYLGKYYKLEEVIID